MGSSDHGCPTCDDMRCLLPLTPSHRTRAAQVDAWNHCRAGARGWACLFRPLSVRWLKERLPCWLFSCDGLAFLPHSPHQPP